jgi:hypothetical protein
VPAILGAAVEDGHAGEVPGRLEGGHRSSQRGTGSGRSRLADQPCEAVIVDDTEPAVGHGEPVGVIRRRQ